MFPLGTLAKIFLPVMFFGTLAWEGTQPRKPDQCALYQYSRIQQVFTCFPGSSKLHLTSLVHSPASIVFSVPVKVSSVPPNSGWYGSGRVVNVYDSTDIVFTVSSTRSFTETVTFAKDK